MEPEENTQKRTIIRKSPRGLRLSGHLTLQATREVESIQQTYGTRTYDILSTAAVFYARAMRGEISIPGMPMLQPTAYRGTPGNLGATGAKRAESHTTRALSAAKAVWCTEAGGTVDGNICNFTKYEVTLAGTTEAMPRSVALQDMPDLKEDFMKNILGGYSSVYEAQHAAEKKGK